ncbi:MULTISPECIES: EutN/CcmL family microcompartment protein [Streptococcus]|uniref:Ethanolamine utilization protein n=2 Tax=Streptococcus TaxID=1301 RepID=A0A2Z5TVR6_9STRE|nr:MULTISPECIES: EutN/CcmL family microcompartment protein [Streptococcus]MDQ8758826.1 EutN/CcmL family microcompartment protein [Streptococcus ruminantium]MDQ8765417.1 EutN/CcmL family microcompartment protein [Streptococcus ruminantium]MDQ8766575.1 EutN/CcmL family microcompartment protein [Streptococcus ruminantium]MDQ8768256.1 EutN/CcmL family microcompartment protein [Streptococcus ruminantium]MDQ8774664.1 EutN/CcmL family microcompartment protein [Streptococcus ruminantium]
MLVAELVDTIWATRKSDALNGAKFLLAKVVGGSRSGEIMVVADMIGAGIGDRVIVATGSAARRMMENDLMPVDAAVIGIIDENYDQIKQQNGEINRLLE